jgi:hypothetical protein
MQTCRKFVVSGQTELVKKEQLLTITIVTSILRRTKITYGLCLLQELSSEAYGHHMPWISMCVIVICGETWNRKCTETHKLWKLYRLKCGMSRSEFVTSVPNVCNVEGHHVQELSYIRVGKKFYWLHFSSMEAPCNNFTQYSYVTE